jgi:hypothetical protein
MTTPRREFLGWVGASAVLSAVPASLGAASPTTPASSADWDLSWRDRLKGSHRAVFDAPEVSEGLPLARACLWGKQYAEVFGAKPADLNAVLVLRHNGIALGMDDDFWTRFPIGKEAGIKGANGEFVTVNPVRKAWPDRPEPWRNFNIEQFRADGGIVLGCNLAFMLDVVPKYQEAMKLSNADAVALAKTHLLPGVILQPSGFFAVSAAQESGCQFIPAS